MHHHVHRFLCRKQGSSSSGSHTIFAASVGVFLVLNIVENIVHYSIGRQSSVNPKDVSSVNQKDTRRITLPTAYDFARIIVVMLLFAMLQGFFTWLLTSKNE
jgi:hypothetical protein